MGDLAQLNALVARLAKRIQSMTPAEQLRFAAILLEERRADLALPIIEGLAEALRVVLAAASGGAPC